MNAEVLAKLAQKFLSESPVLVLGSGASAPYGLPTMPQLAELLLRDVNTELPGWKDFAADLHITRDLEQTLNRVELPSLTVEFLLNATWNIVGRADVRFFESLLTGAPAFPLAELLRYLLRTSESHVHIVTTNYDRIAEYAANHVSAFASTGFTSGWLQRFVPVAAQHEKPPSAGFEGQVTIHKVHGSLDWFGTSTGQLIGIPGARSRPATLAPLIVTPGISKYREVHKDPFRSILSATDAALRLAKSYLCIGYGFADEHVQPVLLGRVLNDDIPIVVVTKRLTPETRRSLLDARSPKKFLLLEEADGGTKVYSHDNATGETVNGVLLWQLDEFLQLVTAD